MNSETTKESASSVESVDEKEIRKHRASLIRSIFGLAKQIHGDHCIGGDELKEEIHEDITRMCIAKPQTDAAGRVRLLSAMTIGQLKELKYEYEQLLGRRPYHRREYRHTKSRRMNPESPITGRQQKFILDLTIDLGWDLKRLSHFCHHQVKKFYPQTRGEANKVIEGLKAIKRKRFSHRRDAEGAEKDD
jgi:hypothetical protein